MLRNEEITPAIPRLRFVDRIALFGPKADICDKKQVHFTSESSLWCKQENPLWVKSRRTEVPHFWNLRGS
jgi:hypothetical protein